MQIATKPGDFLLPDIIECPSSTTTSCKQKAADPSSSRLVKAAAGKVPISSAPV
jgi:hypothetical protein